MPKPHRPGSLDRKTAFLDAFVETGSIALAATMLGLNRGAHYNWIKVDRAYAARFEASKRTANAKLSGKARQKARRVRALQDIADGASDTLLQQIAALINNHNAARVSGAAHVKTVAQPSSMDVSTEEARI